MAMFAKRSFHDLEPQTGLKFLNPSLGEDNTLKDRLREEIQICNIEIERLEIEEKILRINERIQRLENPREEDLEGTMSLMEHVDVKHSRTGLGVDERERRFKARAAKQQEIQRDLKRKIDDVSRRDFQDRQRSSWQAGKISRDYKKAASALAQLEELAGISRGEVKREDDNGDDDKEEEEDEVVVTEEDLMRIVEDLRRRFFYCVYCGCKYDSAEEMEGSCPGLDEDAH
ncbi:G patch domain-containing protein 11-like [Selaginella moellendorffii]|uniref:G patch domain-containing protein 11-like n=1 Tax=Selaginella moellendorffii TaxID=88036 RepID=UPI000D1CB8D9|nr:G patch domain-containing protein 11-like [Selaginella moellendorffii]|eukprot:XP_024536205.1 G patch domain-containing protein 11-like [Selaginella moellendorffii]